ncbi:FAD-dependent oxidoreductase [Acinetobacter brisouii]|uniref:FAD-dependent oxidoreductase n=1 Tax=Acinetobacter brisouii TaxID=396323 RepID=UPI0035AF24F1
MVGICTAIHLQQQGFAVTVIDQSAPGTETSYGNAGIIQTEAVEPPNAGCRIWLCACANEKRYSSDHGCRVCTFFCACNACAT